MPEATNVFEGDASLAAYTNALESLSSMFSTIPRDKIDHVLRMNQGRIEPSVDMLLTLTTVHEEQGVPMIIEYPNCQHEQLRPRPPPRCDKSARQGSGASLSSGVPWPSSNDVLWSVQTLIVSALIVTQCQTSPPTTPANPSASTMSNVPPWFHGAISRGEAERAICAYGAMDGMFLIRESTSVAMAYVLSVANNVCLQSCHVACTDSAGHN